MIFEGRLYKSGKYWIAEIPALDAMTQGTTQAEAITMIKDWLVTAVDRRGFKALVSNFKKEILYVETNENAAVMALLLQRQRQKNGLTVREAAKRLGLKSHNAYAQYERGKSEPSLSKLEEILAALSPSSSLRINFG
jgi:DNA-binding XRE family transcriptional regulator